MTSLMPGFLARKAITAGEPDKWWFALCWFALRWFPSLVAGGFRLRCRGRFHYAWSPAPHPWRVGSDGAGKIDAPSRRRTDSRSG